MICFNDGGLASPAWRSELAWHFWATTLPVSVSVTPLTRQPAINSGSQLTSQLLNINPSTVKRTGEKLRKAQDEICIKAQRSRDFLSKPRVFSVDALMSWARKITGWKTNTGKCFLNIDKKWEY